MELRPAPVLSPSRRLASKRVCLGPEDTNCQECEPDPTQSCDTLLPGVCAAGIETCGPDGFWGDCVPDVQPSELDEVCCDQVDNDCNRLTDLDDPTCGTGACTGPPPAEASVYGTPSSVEGSGVSALLFHLLLPIGAVILLGRVLRKR